MAVFVLGWSACLPDPKAEFDDYAEKTASYRQNGPRDGGDIDSAAPTEAVTGLYVGVCLSQLAAGRLDRVLRFYAPVTFVPDASGVGGKLTIKLTPLKLGPNNTPPPSVSLDQTVGDTFAINEAAVDAKGIYAGTIGTVNVPGVSNPISGRDIVIENTALPGRFAVEKFCSQLSGHVVQPTDIDLTPDANTCLFRAVKEGDPVPTFTNADFDPGCPL